MKIELRSSVFLSGGKCLSHAIHINIKGEYFLQIIFSSKVQKRFNNEYFWILLQITEMESAPWFLNTPLNSRYKYNLGNNDAKRIILKYIHSKIIKITRIRVKILRLMHWSLNKVTKLKKEPSADKNKELLYLRTNSFFVVSMTS